MTFSEFAQILYPFCGAGSRTADFIVLLVDSIMEIPPTDVDEKMSIDDKYNPLAVLAINARGKIYNGSRPIAKQTASKILRHLDKARFEEYIEALPVDALVAVCNALKVYGINTSTQDISSKCADTFEGILTGIAKGGGKLAKTAAIKSVQPHALGQLSMVEFSNELIPSITQIAENHSSLFVETRGYCPNDGCGSPLFISKNGMRHLRYKVTSIKSSMTHTFDNLIALCPKCADEYNLSRTPESAKRLAEIKQTLAKEASALESISEIQLETEISNVLQSIVTVPQDKLIPLNYEPVMVTNKIHKENSMLLRKTLYNVTTYFAFVKDLFQQLSKEGKLRFDTFAMEVKLCYLKVKDDGLSQQQIYDILIEWLRTNTNGSRDACDVVISYFVQNCEVFDEIAK